jgi:hypothetical protein
MMNANLDLHFLNCISEYQSLYPSDPGRCPYIHSDLHVLTYGPPIETMVYYKGLRKIRCSSLALCSGHRGRSGPTAMQSDVVVSQTWAPVRIAPSA